MITCNNISYTRNEKKILSGLGFTLFPGSAMILRGNNGCGKTTLLRMLAGLTQPKTGTITWNEVDIASEPHAYSGLLQYIGHDLAIKPELSVEDNLIIWANMRDSPELLAAAVTYFGLGQLCETPCYRLSAGWQRRVALARLLACHSELWLLDEPFTNLDEEGRRLLLNLISIRCNEGGTVIMTNHGDLPLTKTAELDISDFNPKKRVKGE